MSALTSSIVTSWSGVSTYAKASSSSRCHGVSGPKECPWVAIRAEYRRISSPAISLTCLRARALVFFQSAPPILDSDGDSPPVYLVTWSSWSIGTNSRSPGCPRLDDAYSMTRYSRVAAFAPAPSVRCTISTNRPTPCCSCTT